MISAARQPDPAYTVDRPIWAQIIVQPYRRVAQSNPGWGRSGTGIIQGYIEIGSSGATDCRAILMREQTGVVLDDVAIKDGAYLFRFLAPGNYAVVILDTLGRFRAKVIHTVVP